MTTSKQFPSVRRAKRAARLQKGYSRWLKRKLKKIAALRRR